MHPAAIPAEHLLAQCQVRRERRSGPGGQHRNKVETAVVIEHTPTGIRGEASERRSQEQNRKMALFRLRIKLALEVRAETSCSAAPSKRWQERTRGGRLAINPEHDDFPSLLAEALDALSFAEFDAKQAAERLDVSASQLIKLLKLEPRALEIVNQHRRQRSLRPYQ